MTTATTNASTAAAAIVTSCATAAITTATATFTHATTTITAFVDKDSKTVLNTLMRTNALNFGSSTAI